MSPEGQGPVRLGRREFIRRAAMVALAAIAAERTYGLVDRRSLALALDAIPPLDASGTVLDVIPHGEGLVALSCDGAAGVVVWAYVPGDTSWSRIADAFAFPAGTSLAGIATLANGSLLAAGALIQILSTQPIVDENGQQSEHQIEQSIPAMFSSADGSNWESVSTGIPAATYGAFTAITTDASTGQVIAAGSQFSEPGPLDPVGLIGVASSDGTTWTRLPLDGVTAPVHGGPTLLAFAAGELLLGTSGIDTTALFVAAEPSGTWRPIPAPRTQSPVVFVAAAATATEFLLAAVDATDQPVLWHRAQGAWTRVALPPAVPKGGKLLDLETVGTVLVGSGSDNTGGFVRVLGG